MTITGTLNTTLGAVTATSTATTQSLWDRLRGSLPIVKANYRVNVIDGRVPVVARATASPRLS